MRILRMVLSPFTVVHYKYFTRLNKFPRQGPNQGRAHLSGDWPRRTEKYPVEAVEIFAKGPEDCAHRVVVDLSQVKPTPRQS